MGEVQTFRGPVAADDLGTTLIHEHVFVGHPELDLNLPHPEWSEDDAIEAAVAGLERLWDLGVRTVVDLTVLGLGRDVARVGRVAARTRVHLVASTGYYTADVLPAYFQTHGPGRLVGGPDPLVELFLARHRGGHRRHRRPGRDAQGGHRPAGHHAGRAAGDGGGRDRAPAYRRPDHHPHPRAVAERPRPARAPDASWAWRRSGW